MKEHAIYLAGGMRSGWQDRVTAACSGIEFFDPRKHGLTASQEYTAWDLLHVRECDVLFAYLSADNPSGLGLALEVGYAKALRKVIVLVDERSPQDAEFGRYFAIVAASADVRLNDLDAGIRFLQSLSR